MKAKNTCPVVVKKPTGRVGGTNKELTVSKTPTKYKGGISKAPAGATPSKGGKKK